MNNKKIDPSSIDAIDLGMKFTNEITATLASGKPVKFRGFGVFTLQKVKGRKAVHNFSKKTIAFKPYNRIVFTALPLIKEVINRKKALKTRLK